MLSLHLADPLYQIVHMSTHQTPTGDNLHNDIVFSNYIRSAMFEYYLDFK